MLTSSSFRSNVGPAHLSEGEYSLSNIRLRVSFHHNQSWVVRGSQTSALLTHEQGHMDITRILARDLCRRLMSEDMVDVVFHNAREANSYMMDQARGMMRRATALLDVLQSNPIGGMPHDGLYDTDTVHGTNTTSQAKWTAAFQHAIATDTPLTMTLMVFEIVPGLSSSPLTSTALIAI